MWGVRQERSIPHEKGFIFHHGHIDKVEALLESLSSDFEAVIPMAPPRLREAASHSMGKSTAPVVALPPFATLMTEVSRLPQQFGQGIERIDVGYEFMPALLVEFRILFGVFWRRVVARNTVAVRVVPRGQGHQGRPAQGGGNIATRKDDRLAGQSIDMGRPYMGMIQKRVIAPGLIVADDELHIGPVGCHQRAGKQG